MSIAAVNARPAGTPKAQPAPPLVTRPALQIRSSHDDKRKILFVTSELTDLVKTGGLADVSAALPRALGARHDVRVLIPGFSQVINKIGRAHV